MAKPTGKKPGPPKDVPRITERQFTTATNALKMGMTVTDACRLAGIHRDSLYKWKKVGESMPHGPDPKQDPLPRQFADALAHGELSAKHTALAAVYSGMRKDWKAGAWLLGVRHPKQYGPKVKVTVEAELERALKAIAKVLPEDAYEKVLDALDSLDSEEGEGETPDPETNPLR